MKYILDILFKAYSFSFLAEAGFDGGNDTNLGVNSGLGNMPRCRKYVLKNRHLNRELKNSFIPYIKEKFKKNCC
jgi:hypothetical protein